jgi:hypothetical protein
MPGELIHFDIPADDVEKLVGFYKAVMGWKIEKVEDMGEMEYWLIGWGEDNPVGGGIGKKMMPQQTCVNYYVADDGIEAFNQKVKDNGGTVMMEKMPVPGWGWFSMCMDPEGNPFASWVDDKDAK